MRNSFFIFFFLLFAKLALAQSVLDVQTSLAVNNVLVEDALFVLMQNSGVNIVEAGSILPPQYRVTINENNQSIAYILDLLFENTLVGYTEKEQQIVLVKLEPPIRKFTLSGYISDADTGEALIGANVFIPSTNKGTATNDYGFFSLTVSEGDANLVFSYLGYEILQKEINLNKDYWLNIELQSSLTLDPVIVIPHENQLPQNDINQPDLEGISIEQIKLLPTLGGEADIWRSNYLQAGVSTGTDGVGGLIVRGGSVDQNLVLLDGVPVYNPTHAIGIFSIFNTDAVKSANLYKSRFPARYSGRLSSVLDIRTKEGNKKEFEADASFSLISGKASIEGPIVKDKVSFFLSGRHSFTQWYIPQLTQAVKRRNARNSNGFIPYNRGGFSDYLFFDWNAKIHADLSKKNKLFLSFYKGGDDFFDQNTEERDGNFLLNLQPQEIVEGIIQDTTNLGFAWGNTTATLRWNHLINQKLFTNTTVNYSAYDFNSKDEFFSIGRYDDNSSDTILVVQRFRSNIENWSAKTDWEYTPSPNHHLRFGLGASRQSFQPGVFFDETKASNVPLLRDSIEFFDTLDIAPQIAYEYTSYFEDEIQLTPKWSVNIGLHAVRWSIDQVQYNSLQPRISTRFKPKPKWTISVSYSQMVQHLHFLTKSNLGLPGDIWVPSTAAVDPERAWQVVGGVHYQGDDNSRFSIEGYYKKMDHLISFLSQDSLVVLSANDWERNITTGQGWNYGVETSFSKQTSKYSIAGNYTLAWSERQFDKINNGERFPFRYDRRHSFKLVGQYALNKKLNLNTSWIIESGARLTLPVLEYPVRVAQGGFIVVQDPGPTNRIQMPAYHRLDIGLNYEIPKTKYSHHINFGIFNVYNQPNPIFYRERENEIVQVTLLPFLPSFSYGIKFNPKKKDKDIQIF